MSSGTVSKWRYLRKKRVWIPTSLLAFMAVGYTAWWWVAAYAIERTVQSHIENERRMGTAIAYDALHVAGFPLRLRAEANAVTMLRTDGLAWQAPAMSAEIVPWKLDTIEVALAGTHRVVLPNIMPVPIAVSAEGGSGRFTLQVDWLPRKAEIALHGITVALADLTAAGQGPNPLARHLGERIEQVALTVHAVGGLPPSLEPGPLAEWSRDGGKVEIDSLAIDWGPLSIRASGTWILDADLQPSGSLDAEIRGAMETVDALVEAGVLRAEDVRLAKIGIQALTPRIEGEQQGVTKAPLAVRNQHLWIGPFKLVRLPRIEWHGRVS